LLRSPRFRWHKDPRASHLILQGHEALIVPIFVPSPAGFCGRQDAHSFAREIAGDVGRMRFLQPGAPRRTRSLSDLIARTGRKCSMPTSSTT